jgi:hypothetical protein
MANLYDEKILGTKQKIALAQKLRESGQDMLQGQMIGDRYVAPSWTQHLAQGLQQGLGIYGEMKGEEELKNIQREKAQATARALNQMGMAAPEDVLKSAEVPAQSPSVFSRLGAFVTGEDQPKGVPAQPYQQAIAQNLTPAQSDAALLNLMNASPELGAGAIGLSNTRATREATAAEKAYQHQKDIIEQDWKEKSFNQQQQFQAQQKEADRTLREMALNNRPQPQAPQGSIVEIVDPKDSTKLIKINSVTGEVYGTSGTEPKALIRQEKAQTKLDEQAKAQENFQSSLYNLRDEYKTLNSLGSIKTDQDSSIANALGVKLKTSTGQLLGTKTGTAISNIEQARKSIIQDIKNATGMSAGQLNSNFELQNMLATVTDPNSSYEAVQDQLNTLSQKFGTGEAIFPERLKLKQQANMVQGQAPVTTQPSALGANQAPKPTVSGW